MTHHDKQIAVVEEIKQELFIENEGREDVDPRILALHYLIDVSRRAGDVERGAHIIRKWLCDKGYKTVWSDECEIMEAISSYLLNQDKER